MRGAITLVLSLILLAVLLLDGYGMFAAFQDSRELALGAAQEAAIALEATGNEGAALKEADTYVNNHDGELLELDYGKVQSQWYRATVRVEPQTFVFKFVPVLNRFLDQESTASYTF